MFKRFIYMLAAASFIFGGVAARAQDAGALLDLLVRKKIISDQEAEEVRSELTKEYATTSAGKWKLSTPITELELYGDARLRYEYRSGQTEGGVSPPNDWQERKRERYRLRIGLRGVLADDWFFGVRLETSQNPRSTNVTFGDDTSTTSGSTTTINGPFAKNSDGINVGQAYLGYRGFKDITLTGGKMPNPLITTLMTWDADINPENPVGAPRTSGGKLVPTTDAWLLAWQVGARFTFPNNLYAQLAPTLYNYTGNGDTFNGHFVGGDPALSNSNSVNTNQVGINSLLVFDMPMEIGWKIGELPVRIFGDFAVNFEADDRAKAAGFPGKGDQRYAYQIGVGIGQLKAKHDWQLQAFWQHTEQFSLDPNLVDSDFFDSRVNMEGIVVQAGYALSDAVIFNLSYGYGWAADKSLGTGGTGDIGINPLNKYQIFQADLNVKF